MEPIFTIHKFSFEKTAAEVPLPPDPNRWPQEIHQELYKQLPFIADFSPTIEMVKVDAEKGYAMGRVMVMSPTQLHPDTPPDALQSAGIRRVWIPIVVREMKLAPLDIFASEDGELLPLTEARFRQALFRPQPFDVTATSPGDTSMINQLFPPYRQQYGFGGGGVVTDGGKMAAAKACCKECGKESCLCREKTGMLAKIAHTITPHDLQKFSGFLSAPEHRALYKEAGLYTAPAIQHLLAVKPQTAEKVASALADSLPPNVVQVTRAAGAYRVKTANANFFEPQETWMDRGAVVAGFGEKVALGADLSGSVTMSDAPETGAEGPAPAAQAVQVSQFGAYQVQAVAGEKMTGFVFPNLLDVDNTPLPIALFVSDTGAMLQAEVAGVPIPSLAENLPQLHLGGHPKGTGVFVRETAQGLEATIPFDVQASLTAEGDVSFMASTFDGRSFEVSIQPQIQELVVEGQRLLVPDGFQWMPVGQLNPVPLLSSPSDISAAQVAEKTGSVHVVLRGLGPNSYSISGAPVAKVAYELREGVSIDDTMFLLATVGVAPTDAVVKMAEALSAQAPIYVPCTRAVTPLDEALSASREKAASIMAALPQLRAELWKEAAGIQDPTAVDTILSLGFINPENMATFVDSLPQLEQTQRRLCDLLLAVRLGMPNIEASPLERCIKTLDEVISGLKLMAFKN